MGASGRRVPKRARRDVDGNSGCQCKGAKEATHEETNNKGANEGANEATHEETNSEGANEGANEATHEETKGNDGQGQLRPNTCKD